MSYGYPYRGQPSVVFSVPFTLGAGGDVLDDDAGRLRLRRRDRRESGRAARDGRIDHRRSAGRAGQRRRSPAPDGRDRRRRGWSSRFVPASSRRAARGADWMSRPSRSPTPSTRTSGRTCTSSCPRARPAGSRKYEVRVSIDGADRRGRRDVVHPGPAGPGGEREDRGADGPGRTSAPARRSMSTSAASTPSTHYWVGVRAVDNCNRPGPHAVVELTTTRDQLHDSCPRSRRSRASASSRPRPGDRRCEPTVTAMRRARDRLLADVPLFAVAADLYGRSGPAAAGGPPAQRHGPGAGPRSCWGPSATTAEAVDPGEVARTSEEAGATSVVDKGAVDPYNPAFLRPGSTRLWAPTPRKDEVFRQQCPRSISS